MKICTRCHVLCTDVCPVCGKSRQLKEPTENEPVLLATLSPVASMMLEPVLAESGIPFNKLSVSGAAIAAYVGTQLESHRFYVPYAAYQKARETVENTFAEDAEITRSLHEFDIQTTNEGE